MRRRVAFPATIAAAALAMLAAVFALVAPTWAQPLAQTVTPTSTITATATLAPTVEPTAILAPTVEPTATLAPTVEPTATLTPTVEPTATSTPLATATPTPTPTVTPEITATPTLTPTATPTGTSPPLAVDARIEIVFPHDTQGNPALVPQATLVNVEVFIFQRGTLNPVPCDLPNNVRLRWARNAVLSDGRSEQTPAHDLPGFPASAQGQRLIRTLDGQVFPSWVFNDIPIVFPTAGADLALSKTFFFVEIDGAEVRTNVWSHSADPRTFFPGQLAPAGVSAVVPTVVDSMIQVVFPHDQAGNVQPVDSAPLANVAVDVFQDPLGPSVGPNFAAPVHLARSLNQDFLQVVGTPVVITNTQGTVTYPRWVFNDLDVSAAQNTANKYFFAVEVDGVENHTTIWAHGAEARTIFPQVDVPTSSGAACR